MKKLTLIAFISFAAFALVLSRGSFHAQVDVRAALADEAADADIVDFMVVVNAGKTSLWRQIRDAIAEPGPGNDKAWKGLKARARVAAFMTEEILTSYELKKGEKASWDEQVAKYKDDFEKLAEAAEKKDLDAAKEAVNALKRSCRSCHKPHRP